jgi:hypothetical protein
MVGIRKSQSRALRGNLLLLDAKCGAALYDKTLRTDLAAALAPPATPLKAPVPLWNDVANMLNITAACADTARHLIWSAEKAPTDQYASATAARAIAHLRQPLRMAIYLLNDS